MFRDRPLPREFESWVALGHEPADLRAVYENKGIPTGRLDALTFTIAHTTPHPRRQADPEKAKRPSVINAVARHKEADAKSRKAWGTYRARERTFRRLRREVQVLGDAATQIDHERVAAAAHASVTAAIEAVDLWKVAEGLRCCAFTALGLDPYEDKSRLRAIRRRKSPCLHVWERPGFDDRRGRRDHTDVEWSRSGPVSRGYGAFLALHGFDAPVRFVTVDLGDALEHRFSEGSEAHENLASTFLALARRNLKRTLKRPVPMMVRAEEADNGRPHVHVLTPLHDHEELAAKDALRRADGEWAGAARQFQVDVQTVKDTGALSYMLKDVGAASRFQGVSMTNDLRAVAKEMYRAMVAFVLRCRQEADAAKPKHLVADA